MMWGALPRGAVAALVAVAASGCGDFESFEPGAAPSAPPAAALEEVSLLDQVIPEPAPGDRALAGALLVEAHAQLAEGATREARALLADAIEADPTLVAARLELGFQLLDDPEATNYGDALLHFRTARLLAPKDPLAACGEGIARQEVGDLARAEPLLVEAIESGSLAAAPARHAIALAALGRIDATFGRDDLALRRFDEAAAIPGIEPRAQAIYRSWRADLLAQLDRRRDAEAELLLALELDPENVRAHHLLSRLLAKRGEAEEAGRELRIHEILRALKDHRAKRFHEDDERRAQLLRELDAACPKLAERLRR